MARRRITRPARSGSWHFFHVLMCCVTGGLWIPVYATRYARYSSRRTVTYWR